MKRIISMATVIVGVAAALILGTAGAASAAIVTTTTADGIAYIANDGDPGAGATITGYTPGTANLTIPATVTINGHDYSVTTIGAEAFASTGLINVVIPDTVTTIGNQAFYEDFLATVTLGNSVTTIGDGAFLYNSLTSVTIPASVTTIGDVAFETNDLTSVTFTPGSLTTIGADAFQANQLTSVTIPDSVTTIGNYAFELNSITSLSLGNSVTTIGNYAFYDDHLTNLTIPDSVTTIGNYAFYQNDLTSLSLGNSVTRIGDDAFNDNQLTSVTIPGSVTTVGADAFNENPDLATVFFTGPAPSSVSGLGEGFPFGLPGPVTVLFDVTYAASFTTPTWLSYPTREVASVSYELNGHGDAIAQHYITFATTETRPADPTTHGLTFAGWYTDAALTTRADFSAAITADTTFYAKWSDPAVLALTGDTVNPGLGIGGGVALLVGVLLVASRRRRRTA